MLLEVSPLLFPMLYIKHDTLHMAVRGEDFGKRGKGEGYGEIRGQKQRTHGSMKIFLASLQ